MTGRTHDLAAFSLISYFFIYHNPPSMTLATLVTSLGIGLIGGLYPDLDNASGDIWEKIPGGSFLGKLLAPLLGGHRLISHSILGFALTGFLLYKLLLLINGTLIVDMNIVWTSFMLGYISHIFADSFTKEGIPLFFPIPLYIGIPPIRFLRLNTGGRIEKLIIYPGLAMLTGYIYLSNYNFVLDYFQHQLR